MHAANLPKGNFPRRKLSRGKLLGGNRPRDFYPEANHPGGNCPWGNNPGRGLIIQLAIIWGDFLGGNCPDTVHTCPGLKLLIIKTFS